jgi:hypothetical protein
MKKILSIFVVLILSLNVFVSKAQVTITHEALPQPGDTFALRYDYIPSISIGSPSASSQHWDFSTLVEDTLKFATYGITSTLPFASAFPTSNLYTYGPSIMYGGPGTPMNYIQWGWMMFNTSVNGMSVIGYRTGETPNVTEAHHDVPLMLVKTPFTLNDSYSQNSQWSVTYNRVQGTGDIDTVYTSYITSSLLCDAWGTINTPIETNVDVVRLKEYRVSVDSVYAMMNGSVVWKSVFARDTVNNYQFYSPTKRHAIATVYCEPNNTINAAEFLYYSDLYNNVAEEIEVKQLMLSPNPTREFLNIDLPCQNASVFIMSQQGKLMKSVANFSTGAIDVKDLASGMYLIVVRCGAVNYNGKFIKE